MKCEARNITRMNEHGYLCFFVIFVCLSDQGLATRHADSNLPALPTDQEVATLIGKPSPNQFIQLNGYQTALSNQIVKSLAILQFSLQVCVSSHHHAPDCPASAKLLRYNLQ